MQTEFDFEFFLHDRHQHVDRDGGPDLGSDGVLRGAIERLDAQMLLDPTEKQLDFPATRIQLGDGQCREKKVVGEKHETFLADGIEVVHPAQPPALGYRIVEHHDLIALQTCLLVDGLRVQSAAVESLFRPSQKESFRLLNAVQPFEVDIAAVHQIDGTGLPDQLIEDVGVVDFSTSDNDHRGNTATQIEQSVQFDGGLSFAELGPGKKRQKQIDGGGIQSVYRMVEFESEGIALVESPCFLNQDLGKVVIDAPIAHLIGIGQGVARHRAANPHVIEFCRRGSQTRFDVSEAFSEG